MQITTSTLGVGDHVNEDYVITGPSWVVVMDGATAPPGVDSGCRHDVRWFVRQLATAVAGSLTVDDDLPLPDVLAQAIVGVRDQHGDGCDLDNPDSPSSTAAILRVRGSVIDYLVLAASAIVFDAGGTVTCVTDDRLERLPSRTPAAVSAQRNRAGGFWVASTEVAAAFEAVSGSLPLAETRQAVVCSDGASRYVELLGLGNWAGLLRAVADDGPAAVLERVRAAEREQLDDDPRAPDGRRFKKHDDATAAHVTFRPFS